MPNGIRFGSRGGPKSNVPNYVQASVTTRNAAGMTRLQTRAQSKWVSAMQKARSLLNRQGGTRPGNSSGGALGRARDGFSQTPAIPTDYKNGLIRVKNKGERQGGKTTGILVLSGQQNNREAWAHEHEAARNFLGSELQNQGHLTPMNNGLSVWYAENSHALRHGGYGRDVPSNALPGSHAHNTEQLAIEEAADAFAKKFPQAGLFLKVTTYADPTTGLGRYQRLKYYGKNTRSHEVKVFDHVMDMRRGDISKREVTFLKNRAKNAFEGRLNKDRRGLSMVRGQPNFKKPVNPRTQTLLAFTSLEYRRNGNFQSINSADEADKWLLNVYKQYAP